MIVYVLSKHTKTPLTNLQQRLWREYEPQAEFAVIQTAKVTEIKRCAGNAIRMLRSTSHRYAWIMHEDCLPLKKMNPDEVLRGKTMAGRTVNGGPHPNRTWLLVDAYPAGREDQAEGSKLPEDQFVAYPERPVATGDFEVDCQFMQSMQWCEPGFLHLDSMVRDPDSERSLAKADWIKSVFPDYAKLPPMHERVVSFGKSLVKHVKGGMQQAELSQWMARANACENCDQYDGKRCVLCGCNIKVKARWKEQTCPLDRWPVVEGVSDES